MSPADQDQPLSPVAGCKLPHSRSKPSRLVGTLLNTPDPRSLFAGQAGSFADLAAERNCLENK